MNCVNKEISLLPGPGSIEAMEIGDGFLKKTNGCEVSSETDLKQIKTSNVIFSTSKNIKEELN